jgi:hypothetical protein
MIECIERSIAGDMEMGNFSQIHHVWMPPDTARLIGITADGETTRNFRVPHPLDIVFCSDIRRRNLCQVELGDGSRVEIDLQLEQSTEGCFDPYQLTINLQRSVCEIGHSKLAGARILIHEMVGFVAILQARASISKVIEEMQMCGRAMLSNVPFVVNHPFKVVVSTNEPRAVQPVRSTHKVTSATVDKDGWMLGYRTPEEVAAIPAKYRW